MELTQNCISENARIDQDQGEYQKLGKKNAGKGSACFYAIEDSIGGLCRSVKFAAGKYKYISNNTMT